MYPSRIDLEPRTRERMIDLLQARLAGALDLRAQAKVAHWNVKGRQFVGLHELFDEVAHAFDAFADLLAERVVQLGGLARGTVQQVAAATELEEYSAVGGTEAHVTAVAEALAGFGSTVRRAIDQAAEAGDQTTADIFTEVSRGVDKFLWMVEAHLQEEVAAEARQPGQSGADDAEGLRAH